MVVVLVDRGRGARGVQYEARRYIDARSLRGGSSILTAQRCGSSFAWFVCENPGEAT